MGIQQTNWLKGNLPTWIAVGLLGILTWGAKETYDDFKRTIGRAIDELHTHDTRISVLEDWRKRKDGGSL